MRNEAGVSCLDIFKARRRLERQQRRGLKKRFRKRRLWRFLRFFRRLLGV